MAELAISARVASVTASGALTFESVAPQDEPRPAMAFEVDVPPADAAQFTAGDPVTITIRSNDGAAGV